MKSAGPALLMPIKNQVCSFAAAKRLNEAGIKRDTLFYWCHLPGRAWFLEQAPIALFYQRRLSAPTVAELGEVLRRTKWNLPFPSENLKWDWIMYKNVSPLPFDTEADARAELVIHLRSVDIIKP